jgi:hypothetical protein
VWEHTHSIPRLDDPNERAAIEQAYWELGSLEWWFRRTYNLPPTDPRFLNASLPDIKHDYWLHTLSNRIDTAIQNEVPIESLDDIVAGVTPQERAAAIEKDFAAKAAAKTEETPTEEPSVEEEQTEELETVIDFRGKRHG